MKKGDTIQCQVSSFHYDISAGQFYAIVEIDEQAVSVENNSGRIERITNDQLKFYFVMKESVETPDTRKQDFIEKASIAAMQGILASGVYGVDGNAKYLADANEARSRCEEAVLWAESLWNQLNQKP